MLLRIFKRTLFVGLLALLLVTACKLIWVWALAPDGMSLLKNRSADDVVSRSNYLMEQFEQGHFEPQHMPHFIGEVFQGEWAIGTCSMTTAALTNIAFHFPETRQQAQEEVEKLIKLALHPKLRAFDTTMWGEDALATLEGPHGHIGYLGHLNLMLAAYRLLGGDGQFDLIHRQVNSALSRRYQNAPFPYLQTYPGEIYSADNTAALASLQMSALVTGQQVQPLCKRWVTHTRQHVLDPQTGLIAFSIGADGQASDIGRGSGIGWNSFYLPYIDSQFAQEQYQLFREQYLTPVTLGMWGAREYAPGLSGSGDIDSGPVILGISPSGTGFAIAGARLAGDVQALQGLLRTAEVFGFSLFWNDRRHYLTAPLVGEAIVLAMKTAVVWDARFLHR